MKKQIVILLLLMVFFTACSNKEIRNTGNHKGNDQERNINKDEDGIKDLISYYPLTGLPSEGESQDRAVSVMINNHPSARPQTGLTEADIVYEVLAEGDITRFLAIFQSERPELVGPVRSARDYYITLSQGYQSLYIAHGYSPEAKKILTSGTVDQLNGMQYDGTLFTRSSSRVAPHNSYIRFSNIIKGAKQNHFSLEGAPQLLPFLNKEELKDIDGEEKKIVTINYGSNATYNSQFRYDAEIEKYIRFSNREQTVDYETNEPVAVDNVFIIAADHRVVDTKGRKDIDLTSGGDAYLLQKGKAKKVKWVNKNGRILPIVDNKEVGLVPGKTWINIIPSNPGLEYAVLLN